MKQCLIFLLFLLAFNVSAQTIDQVRKFKSASDAAAPTQPSAKAPTTTSSAKPAAPINEAEEINKLLRKDSGGDQPFNFLLNPNVQKLAKFLSNKKVVSALNTFSDKEKMRKMFIAQCALMIGMFILRAWLSPNTKTFMAGFIANIWLTALYLFVSLLVLPNFIYGSGYFDFVKEAYALTKEFTG